jgi:hypothetical protein
MRDDERELWTVDEVTCVMVSCCAGAELQVRRRGEILLRELYPSKSDLYDRARDLKGARLAAASASQCNPTDPPGSPM